MPKAITVGTATRNVPDASWARVQAAAVYIKRGTGTDQEVLDWISDWLKDTVQVIEARKATEDAQATLTPF